MRHRYRIGLIGLLLAGCGVQEAPPAPSATSVAAGQAAAPPAYPYPPRREESLTPLVIYPTRAAPPPDPTPSPIPAPVVPLPASVLPADRIWLAGEQLLAIGRDGSALRFEIPAETVNPEISQAFYAFIERAGAPPLGIFAGGPEADWYLADPAAGTALKLPLGGSSAPGGLAGAEPNHLLLYNPEGGAGHRLQLARVDLAQGTAALIDVPEPGIFAGELVAWRDQIAYVASLARAGGEGRRLWRVDLSQSPPTAVELFELDSADDSLQADQTHGLLLARKAGAANATLIDLASGAEEELPIPVGRFSPDGALIAAMRTTQNLADLVIYNRADRSERTPVTTAPSGGRADLRWFRSGAAVLMVPAGDGRGVEVDQLWVNPEGTARRLSVERPLKVAPLDDDHLLVLREDELAAPALDGGPPAFASVPLAWPAKIVYVP